MRGGMKHEAGSPGVREARREAWRGKKPEGQGAQVEVRSGGARGTMLMGRWAGLRAPWNAGGWGMGGGGWGWWRGVAVAVAGCGSSGASWPRHGQQPAAIPAVASLYIT